MDKISKVSKVSKADRARRVRRVWVDADTLPYVFRTRWECPVCFKKATATTVEIACVGIPYCAQCDVNMEYIRMEAKYEEKS